MSVGWRLLLLAALWWLPAPKGNKVILAPLTLLGRGVVLPSLERPVVAAAIAVGIALTSKPSQLSQQVAYSPARGLAPLPGDGIVIAVRAEYVVNHRTRLDVSLSPCILPYWRGDKNFCQLLVARTLFSLR
jgi:predicted acyltransferase